MRYVAVQHEAAARNWRASDPTILLGARNNDRSQKD